MYSNLPRKKIPLSSGQKKAKLIVYENTHTVCEEARCPNREECSRHGLATFLINGSVCTRNCSYCNVENARPVFDAENRLKEIEAILNAIEKQNISYAVITAPSRDDLADGGSSHFLNLAIAIQNNFPETKMEFLIPDFHFSLEAYTNILKAKPYVLAHNLEVVSSLYKKYRKQASYTKSLGLLEYFSAKGFTTKTSIMLGFGESEKEIQEFLKDSESSGVKSITLGQYLAPAKEHPSPVEILSKEKWQHIKAMVDDFNFVHSEVGSFVRSSYMAHRILNTI